MRHPTTRGEAGGVPAGWVWCVDLDPKDSNLIKIDLGLRQIELHNCEEKSGALLPKYCLASR